MRPAHKPAVIGDLFGQAPTSASQLREEERFGLWDARTGLPLHNHYSLQLTGERLAAYDRGYRLEIGRLIENQARQIGEHEKAGSE